MLNKKLVLGSLAGATLLAGAMFLVPSAQAAGVVSGVCTGCHTMHNSVDLANPAAGGPYAYLLLQNGCVGCHTGSANNTTTGLGTGTVAAPQVDAAGTPNAGGYFNTDTTSHSVAGSIPATFTAPLATAPGGTMPGAAFTCENCHTAAAGGHHSNTGGYRMLGAANTSTGPTNYGQTGTVATYDSASMNLFCAGCHGGFHGVAGQGAGPSAFIRHPTDNNSTHVSDFAIPTGATNQVMCISCHTAHGSSQTDLLRFTYADNLAGDSTAANGCETCHNAK